MRSQQYVKMINSARWRRLRAEILREHPLCQRCEAEGYYAAATEVHHRDPVDWARTPAERERRMFSPMNLMALCHRCHVEVHTSMGRSGRKQAAKSRDAEVKAAISKLYGAYEEP